MSTMIKAENVSMCYKLANEKHMTLKEYAIALAKHQLQYSDFWVFRDISFEVEKGDIVGIIGRNGAGKSTLLKIISGVLKATEGNVQVNGNIVPMLELGSGFDFDLTGKENIFLNGAILGYSEAFLKEKYDEIVEFSELGDFIERPIRNYSSGMVARLAFAIATVVQPEVLIVDEILGVGDEAFQKKSKRRMLSLMDGGCTVLFVSHSIEQIREMCNKVLWIEDGKMRMFGDAKKICDTYQEFINPSNKYDNLQQGKYLNKVREYARDTLFVYGNRNINNYIWRVAVGKEQLLAAGMNAGEVYIENITDDLIYKNSNIVFSCCEYDENIRKFIELAKLNNRNCYIDVTSASDPTLSIYKNLGHLIDGVIIPSKKLINLFSEKTNIFINPYTALERVRQLSFWAVYDRDVLPFVDKDSIESEDMMINYNRALQEKRKREDKYTRIGYFQMSDEDEKYKTGLVSLFEYARQGENIEIIISDATAKKNDLKEYEGLYDTEKVDSFEDLPKLFSLLDFVARPSIGDDFDEENDIQRIMASLVKVPFVTVKNNGAIDNKNDVEDAYNLERSKTTIGAGFDIRRFINSNNKKVIAIAIEQKENTLPKGIESYVIKNMKEGNILYFLGSKESAKTLLINGKEYNVISTDDIYTLVSFDVLISSSWRKFDYLSKYEFAAKKYYFVENLEEEKFDDGDFSKFKYSMTFANNSGIKYLCKDSIVQKDLKERYDISAEILD